MCFTVIFRNNGSDPGCLYIVWASRLYTQSPDIYFYPKRNQHAAYEFFKRVLKAYSTERQPKILNTDKQAAYGYAIARLIKEGKLRDDVKQRQIKTLSNRIESDHAPIKKLIIATGGFKSPKRAWSTIQGFETLRKLNKGQFDDWLRHDYPGFRVRELSALINQLFNIETVFV